MEALKTYPQYDNLIIKATIIIVLQPTLVSVLRDRIIQYAAAGVSHSIFLDAKGVAYTCGKGNGLLGHGETKIRTVPQPVAKLQVSTIELKTTSLSLSLSLFRV